jgi:hypothetical protein
MVRENEIRRAEVAVEMPPTADAGLLDNAIHGFLAIPFGYRMASAPAACSFRGQRASIAGLPRRSFGSYIRVGICLSKW